MYVDVIYVKLYCISKTDLKTKELINQIQRYIVYG